VAGQIPASSASSSTALATFNYTDQLRSVDPIKEEFFNILLGELRIRLSCVSTNLER